MRPSVPCRTRSVTDARSPQGYSHRCHSNLDVRNHQLGPRPGIASRHHPLERSTPHQFQHGRQNFDLVGVVIFLGSLDVVGEDGLVASYLRGKPIPRSLSCFRHVLGSETLTQHGDRVVEALHRRLGCFEITQAVAKWPETAVSEGKTPGGVPLQMHFATACTRPQCSASLFAGDASIGVDGEEAGQLDNDPPVGFLLPPDHLDTPEQPNLRMDQQKGRGRGGSAPWCP